MKGLFFCLLAAAVSHEAGTVAHYRFDSAKLDEPLYELRDASGNGHDGRVLGQEPFELTMDAPSLPGVSGAALDLRGRLDYAVIPHHADFAHQRDWTIEFFIKPALFHQEHGGATNIAGPSAASISTNLSYTILAKQNSGPTKYGSAWAFHYQPANGWVIFTISYGTNKGEMLLAGKDLRDGQWHHIAVVFRTSIENELRLYVDGFRGSSVNQHGGNVPIAWGDGPIYVGAFARQDSAFLTADRNFDGMLDEIRFSDQALDTQSFVVNFGPFLFPPIPVEARHAVEIVFEGTAGQIYRIEQQDSSGAWGTLGYALGEGRSQSFFHRRESPLPPVFRVMTDDPAGEPVPFAKFDAVEVRFPTEPRQLYTVSRSANLSWDDQNQVFVLGDGAKYSHFERKLEGTLFYRIDRY